MEFTEAQFEVDCIVRVCSSGTIHRIQARSFDEETGWRYLVDGAWFRESSIERVESSVESLWNQAGR
jgi:hypothetical protein